MDAVSSTLFEIISSKRTGVFCGAGISFNSGLPLVPQIIEYFLKSYGCTEQEVEDFFSRDEDGRKLLPIPFESVIESIKDNFTSKNNRVFIEDFANQFIAEPNKNHQLLAHLLHKGLLRYVVTTNFDTCIEDAYHALFKENIPRIIGYHEEIKKLQEGSLPDGSLIKLHGSREFPSTLGTTLSQITDNLESQKIKLLIEKIFSRENCDCIVFLGYSCSDYFDISKFLNELYLQDKYQNLPEIIYFQHGDTLDTNPKELLSSKNTRFLHGYTDSVVNHLIKHFSLNTVPYNKLNSPFSIEAQPINPFSITGFLFAKVNQYEICEKYCKKAISLENALSKNNYYLALTRKLLLLSNLIILYFDNGFLVKAENLIQEAINIAEELEPRNLLNPSIYLQIYISSGKIKMYLMNYTEAENYLNIAMNIVKTHSRVQHIFYEERAFQVFDAFGILHQRKMDYTKSIESYIESIKLLRVAAEKNVHNSKSNLAKGLNNLGSVYYDSQNYRNAKECLNESLSIYNNLFKQNEIEYGKKIVELHIKLGGVYENMHQLNKSMRHYSLAKKLLPRIASIEDYQTLDSLGSIHFGLGNLYYSKKNNKKANIYYKKAFEHNKKLEKFNKTQFMAREAVTNKKLGEIAMEEDRLYSAATLLKNSMNTYKILTTTQEQYLIEYSEALLCYCQIIQTIKPSENLFEYLKEAQLHISRYHEIDASFNSNNLKMFIDPIIYMLKINHERFNDHKSLIMLRKLEKSEC